MVDQEAVTAPFAPYPDVPIDSRKQIRILTLLPGRSDDQIQCELAVRTAAPQSLSHPNPAPYAALSYTWGSWENHEWIKLNGLEYPVTLNLHRALRRLRQKHAITLWIDQLCINQFGIEERNHQVRIMGNVYRLAERVFVWLGDVDDEIEWLADREKNPSLDPAGSSGSSFDHRLDIVDVKTSAHRFSSEMYPALRKWSRSRKFLQNGPSIRAFSSFLGHEFSQRTVIAGSEHTISTRDVRLLIGAILSRPPGWWERHWVVQEFVNAEVEPMLLVGPYNISCKHFLEALDTYSPSKISESFRQGLNDPESPSEVPEHTLQDWMVDPRDEYRSRHVHRSDFMPLLSFLRDLLDSRTKDPSKRTLVSWADTWMNTDSKEPRDKVYALLGLVSEETRQKLAPNYTKPVAQVYAEATYESLISSGFNIFCLTDLRKKPGLDLPTWVHDFRRHPSARPPASKSLFLDYAPSMRPWWWYRKSTTSMNSETLALSTSGISFEKVAATYGLSGWGPIITTDHGNESRLMKLARQLAENGPFTTLLSSASNESSKERVRAVARPLAEEGDLPWTCTTPLFQEWFGALPRAGRTVPMIKTPSASDIETSQMKFAEYLRSASFRATLFVSESGFLGLAPGPVKAGDVVVLLYGSHAPNILRPAKRGDVDCWTFQGFAYVNGIMNNEVKGSDDLFKRQEREFVIV